MNDSGEQTEDFNAELEALAVRKLNAQFPDQLVEVVYFRGEVTIRIPKEQVIPILTYLRDDRDLLYNMMTDITAADYPEREQRFDVVYQLYSLPYNQRLRVKAAVGEEESIPTVAELFKIALFQEREVYDMFGIQFANFPNLRRILLPQDWEGHPLRKDYPLEGYH